MSSATTLMAYSMSKPITAAATLQLVESRKIELDDPLARHLESRPYGPDVTVGQLLSHTSGIPNPIPLRWVHAAALHDTFDEAAALANVLRKHPKLLFPPGTQYRYSNIGYWLLGSIIERASGEPFASYVRKRVLQPLQISSHELEFFVPDWPNHAKGYLERRSFLNLLKRVLIAGELIGGREGRWVHINAHYVNGAAFGGLVGSARGFAKFLQDQLRPRSALFRETTRDLFYAPQTTNSGAPVPMTLGWHIGAAKGIRFFYKEGGGGGFRCMMRQYREAGIATIAMINATGFDVAGLLDRLDFAFL